MSPPDYFHRIEQEAQQNWALLDSRPAIAGPWHQLFRQVQSPRHVISELLQNADDAGAKSASVRIENGTFIFEHDGADFDAEQFASLCRFGFSNKRTLHTIGFRGVGFKSTFSLGDNVEVWSRTLGVCFHKARFTLPHWIHDGRKISGTQIRVLLSDKNREADLQKNLQEWAKSPASLLFFKRLSKLTLGNKCIEREHGKAGPTRHATRARLRGDSVQELVIVQSELEPFPPEAIDEIRQERNIEDLHLPPCAVEVVLGLDGEQRLYVVLPTGASVNLPYSANAPFLQDPARFGIKEPSISPTNRWLLERIGRLVATTLHSWTGNHALSQADRASAYDLIPESHGDEGTPTRAIVDAFTAQVSAHPFILTTEGKLVNSQVAAVPAVLHRIWSNNEVRAIFAGDAKHLLATEVTTTQAGALAAFGWISQTAEADVITRLKLEPPPPKPAGWPQLLRLWTFAKNSERIRWDWADSEKRALALVPVVGSPNLHAAKDIVRVSTRKDLLRAEDWQWLAKQTLVLDMEWPSWLTTASNHEPAERASASLFLQPLQLDGPTGPDRIVAQAAHHFFSQKGTIPLSDCVRLAQILAALGATVPDGFQFVTRDFHRRTTESGLVFDPTGTVSDLVPETWAKEHVLHDAYHAEFVSCSRDVWEKWVRSAAAELHLAPPVLLREVTYYSRLSLNRFVSEHDGMNPTAYHYKRDNFLVRDYSIDDALITHWSSRAQSEPNIWSRVLTAFLESPPHLWVEKLNGSVAHLSGSGNSKPLNCGSLTATWITHFRGVACLPDTYGRPCAPAELVRLTPDTEALRDIEPFVRLEFDTEQNRPLLKSLGVRDTPGGTDIIISRLSKLSKLPTSPLVLQQIGDLYRALDRVVSRCRPSEVTAIGERFREQPLVFAEDKSWGTSGMVALFPNDENDAPSTLVNSGFRHLSMWPRLGVPERPSSEGVLAWLKSLPSGERLDGSDLQRVRAALSREHQRVWAECSHWLSLESTWAPVGSLAYRITMQSLPKFAQLHPAIRKATADLRGLPVHVCEQAPFSAVPNLGDVIEFRVTELAEAANFKGPGDWFETLAAGLCRVQLPKDEDTHRVRTAAQRLHQTTWHAFTRLDVTPYVGGIPSGESFTPKALWQDYNLYVQSQSAARLYKELADELARPFSHTQVTDTIAACIDRTAEFVSEYLASHFDLDAQVETPRSSPAGSASCQNSPAVESEVAKEPAQIAAEATPPEAVPPSNDTPYSLLADENDSAKEKIATEGHPPKQSLPPKPTVIELYAKQRGFHWHRVEKRYTHLDGRWIGKSTSPFNWEEHGAKGELITQLWATDQKLASGVEIAAELWTLLRQQPDAVTLVLIGDDHAPCALSGHDLLERKDSRQITFHPASYRIVQSDTNHHIP